MSKPSSPGTRLTMAGGIASAVIAVAHLVVTNGPYWPEWIAGALRDRTAGTASFAAFWAQPGGFGLVLLAQGVLLIRTARQGEAAPVLVGVIMVAWIGLCLFLIGPLTGFSLGLVPAGLVLAGAIRGWSGSSAKRPVGAI